jgi:mannosyl-oligosaccharide glucosidase
MAGYGWDEYDVRYGGRQIIHDEGNKIDITTEFVKIPGGKHGGNWGVRVKGTPREDAPQQLYTTMIFYAGMEGLGTIAVRNQANELGIQGPVIMDGSTSALGPFTLEITEGPTTNKHPRPTHPSYAAKPLDRSRILSLTIPEGNLWQAKRMFDLPEGRPLEPS